MGQKVETTYSRLLKQRSKVGYDITCIQNAMKFAKTTALLLKLEKELDQLEEELCGLNFAITEHEKQHLQFPSFEHIMQRIGFTVTIINDTYYINF